MKQDLEQHQIIAFLEKNNLTHTLSIFKKECNNTIEPMSSADQQNLDFQKYQRSQAGNQRLNEQNKQLFDNFIHKLAQKDKHLHDIQSGVKNRFQMNQLMKKLQHKITNTHECTKDNPFDTIPKFNESEIKDSEYLPSFRNNSNEELSDDYKRNDLQSTDQPLYQQEAIFVTNQIQHKKSLIIFDNAQKPTNALLYRRHTDNDLTRFEYLFQNAQENYMGSHDRGYFCFNIDQANFRAFCTEAALRYHFPSRAFYNCSKPQRTYFENLNGSFGELKQNRELRDPLQSIDPKQDQDSFDVINIPVISKKQKTGFSDFKDFPIVEGAVIAGRYQILQYLGEAAFSKAIQCLDLEKKCEVCLKIIQNNKDYIDQSFDEIRLLNLINKKIDVHGSNLLQILDYFYFQEHLFIVTELLKENLYQCQQNKPGFYSLSTLKIMTKNILVGLQALHSLNIIHCDLKPENILISSYSDFKIIDFGSSCFVNDEFSSYIQSRSYRAPEVILGLEYDQKIDIWSLGCIIAELFTNQVLFQSDSVQGLLAKVNFKADFGHSGTSSGILLPTRKNGREFFHGGEAYFQLGFQFIKINENQNEIHSISSISSRSNQYKKYRIYIPKKSSLSEKWRFHLESKAMTSSLMILSVSVSQLILIRGKVFGVRKFRPSASQLLSHPWLN